MAKLGSLWFDIGLNDRTEKDWEKIIKNIEKKGAKLGITIDEKNLHSQISKALQNRKYTIDLSLAIKDNQLEAAIQRAYNRVSGAAGSMAGRIRPSREDQLIRAGAYASSQQALERSRNALAELREARLRDAEATRQQKAANDLLGKSLDSNQRLISGLRNEFMNFYSIYTLQNFLGSLISIGGEFQKQHIALQAMLGDAAKADEIFSKIKGLAVESPFNFKDLTGYAKQLAAFSIPYEELYDTTKRLADISAGLSVDMGRIILAYGQVRSAAFLRGQEVRQFTEAGIPLLDELAKKFTELEGRVVSVGEVFDKISSREVPFQMVKDVLWDLTNEGGQFFNMQEVLTESLSGKLDKLKDSYQIMLSEIANANNGVIGGSLDMLTSWMDKWRSFFKILQSVIIGYGAYKVAVFAANAATAISVTRHYSLSGAAGMATQRLAGEAAAMGMMNVQSAKLIRGMNGLKTATAGVSSALGGWALAISVVAMLGTYLYNSYVEANRLNKELNEIADNAVATSRDEAREYEALVEQLENVTKDSEKYNSIMEKIQTRYGAYLGNIGKEADAYEYLHGKIAAVTEALRNKNIEEARQSGMSKISEEYSDDISESISQLTKDLVGGGISKGAAKAIATTFRLQIEEGLDKGLTFDTGKLLNKILKENGFDKEIQTVSTKRILGVDVNSFDKIGMSAKNLYNILSDINREEKDFSTSLKNAFKGLTPYGPEIEKLEKAFELEKKSIPDDAISKQRQLYLQLLEAKKAVYEKYGQEGEAKKVDAEIASVSKLKDEWRVLATEKLKAYMGLQPSNDEKELEYVDRLRKRYKELQETISTVGVMNPALVKSSRKEASEIKSVLDMFKIPATKSKKDPIADQWKKRIKLIEKALETYKEWVALEGKDKAYQRVQSNQTFAPVLPYIGMAEDISDPSKIWDKVLKEIPKDKKELLLEVGFKVEKSSQDKLKSDIDKSLKDVEEHIKKTTEQWSLYKSLLQSGAGKEQAGMLAFGKAPLFDSLAAQLGDYVKSLLAKAKLDIPFELSEKEASERLGGRGSALYNQFFDSWKAAKDAIEKDTIDVKIKEITVLNKYKSIAEKIRDLSDEYSPLTGLSVGGNGELVGGTQGLSDVQMAYLTEYQEKLSELKGQFLELLPVWQQIFGDHAKQSYAQLELASEAAKQIVANAKVVRNENGKPTSFTSSFIDTDGMKQEVAGDYSLIEKLRKAIEDLYKAGQKKNPFATLAKDVKELFSNKEQEDAATLEEKLAKVGESAAKAADLVGTLAGRMSAMFEEMENTEMADAMSGVESAMNTVSNIGKGFAEGGIVGGVAAIAGEAMNYIGQAFAANKRHKEALKAIMNEAIAQQREYNLLLMEQELLYEKGNTAFGVDAYGKAANAIGVAKDALLDLNSALKGTTEQVNKQVLEALLNSIFRRAKNANGKLKLAYAGLADIEIKTGHKKTGLLGWGKGKDIYSSILDVYPELIEANGKFNKELAQTILNTRTMSDEDKAALQGMISLAEQAEEAYQTMNDYLSDIFGELGNTLSDAMANAFANGTDAAKVFIDSVSDMLVTLAKQMVYSMTLAPIFEKAQKQAEEIMGNSELSEEQKFNGFVGIIDGIIDDAIQQQGYANKLYAQFEKTMKEHGYEGDFSSEDSSGGLSKSIGSTLTEETGSLMASYMNAIRTDVSLDRGYIEKVANEIPKISIIAQAQLTQLEIIARNTETTAVNTGRNADLASEIRDIINGARNNKDKGFYIK